jgi:ppGpp synthetase/RelA/SpoT-type nucleotidyltranferase
MIASSACAVAADYGELAAEYEAEREHYKRLVKLIRKRLRSDLEGIGLEVTVSGRAKTVRSFVKKALRKGYVHPLQRVGDKAGVRVIVHYLADIAEVEEIVASICDIDDRQTKLDALDYDKLGYLGVHLGTRPKNSFLVDADARDLQGRRCEIQIHTKAQSAWAVVSHELLYKTPVELPTEIKRGITRLVALVELFDDEVARFRQEIESHPDFEELAVLNYLDDQIIRYTSERPDRELSAIVVPPLVRTYGMRPTEVVDAQLRPFVEQNSHRLDELYERYHGDTRANPLLFQPEALVLFERLDNAIDQLRAAWPAGELPIDLLDSMAAIWGADTGG